MRQPGLTVYDPEKACPGYTLFAPLDGTSVYLIDMRGNVVHRWQMPHRPGNYGCLLENGNLLFAGRTEGGPAAFPGRGGIVMEVDWEGKVLWEYVDDTLHHDFCRMDNGNTMLLGWELVPPDIARTVRGGIPGTESERGMWCDYFREVTPDGGTTWEWHACQHLDPASDVACPFHSREEWARANTCQVLPGGNVLTSFRVLDTVAIIDKGSGEFAWRWGRGQLGHPHDPDMLENGNILVFDSGWHSVTAPLPGSRVIEVDPKTGEIRWEYKTRPEWKFFSAFISGAQRLPNGNTLICEGMNGRLFEVTREGRTVWEYVNPFFAHSGRFGHSNRVSRAYRYGPGFPGFRGRELRPERFAWLSHLYGP